MIITINFNGITRIFSENSYIKLLAIFQAFYNLHLSINDSITVINDKTVDYLGNILYTEIVYSNNTMSEIV